MPNRFDGAAMPHRGPHGDTGECRLGRFVCGRWRPVRHVVPRVRSQSGSATARWRRLMIAASLRRQQQNANRAASPFNGCEATNFSTYSDAGDY